MLSIFKEKFEEKYGGLWEQSLYSLGFISDTIAEILIELGFMGQKRGGKLALPRN